MKHRDPYEVRVEVQKAGPDEDSDSLFVTIEAGVLDDIESGAEGVFEEAGSPTREVLDDAAKCLASMLARVAMQAFYEAQRMVEFPTGKVVDERLHRARWRCKLAYASGMVPGIGTSSAPSLTLEVHKDLRELWVTQLCEWLAAIADGEAA